MWLSKTLNLGLQKPGSKVNFEFEFDETNEPLIVTQKSHGCSCTETTVDNNKIKGKINIKEVSTHLKLDGVKEQSFQVNIYVTRLNYPQETLTIRYHIKI